MSGETQIKIKIPKEKVSQLKNEIVTAIQHLDNFGALKCDIKLILDVCNHVESAKCIRKSKQKIDKKNLVLDIFDQAFTLDPESRNTISNTIDHLHGDKKIKIEPIIKWFLKEVLNVVVKKLL